MRSVNGATIGDGAVPGPITRRLTEAYVDLVDCDFVAQYLPPRMIARRWMVAEFRIGRAKRFQFRTGKRTSNGTVGAA